MDDGFTFMCGTVPILLLIHGPRPWWLVLAGAVGGLVANLVFGPVFHTAGQLVPLAIVAIAGGSFVGLVADAAMGLAGRTAPARVAAE